MCVFLCYHHTGSRLTPVILKSGESFFQDWDFWTFSDPTHGELPFVVFHVTTELTFSPGIVDYISESEAVSSIYRAVHSFHSHTVIYVLPIQRSTGLLSITDSGRAVMRVDTTDKVDDLRKSIRIHTKDTYNFMLMIMDATHMPTGCGSWPYVYY